MGYQAQKAMFQKGKARKTIQIIFGVLSVAVALSMIGMSFFPLFY
jgi:hypothetical protein